MILSIATREESYNQTPECESYLQNDSSGRNHLIRVPSLRLGAHEFVRCSYLVQCTGRNPVPAQKIWIKIISIKSSLQSPFWTSAEICTVMAKQSMKLAASWKTNQGCDTQLCKKKICCNQWKSLWSKDNFKRKGEWSKIKCFVLSYVTQKQTYQKMLFIF